MISFNFPTNPVKGSEMFLRSNEVIYKKNERIKNIKIIKGMSKKYKLFLKDATFTQLVPIKKTPNAGFDVVSYTTSRMKIS